MSGRAVHRLGGRQELRSHNDALTRLRHGAGLTGWSAHRCRKESGAICRTRVRCPSPACVGYPSKRSQAVERAAVQLQRMPRTGRTRERPELFIERVGEVVVSPSDRHTPGQAALSPDLPQRAVRWRASGVSLACGRSPSRSSSSPQSAATLRPDTVNAPPLPSSKPDPDLLATQDGHAPRVTSGYDGRDSATIRLSACRRLRLDTRLASARVIHAPPPFFAPACSVLIRSYAMG